MTEPGARCRQPRGAGFAARNWLENDGDGGEPGGRRRARRVRRSPGTTQRSTLSGLPSLLLSGRGAAAALPERLRRGDYW